MSLAFTALQPLHARLLAGMHRICFKEPWDEKAMGELLAMPGAAGMLATPGAAGMLATPGAAGMSETLGAGDEGGGSAGVHPLAVGGRRGGGSDPAGLATLP